MTVTSEIPVREVEHDTSLKAHITGSIHEGEDEVMDRSPYVHTGAGLARFVQDDKYSHLHGVEFERPRVSN